MKALFAYLRRPLTLGILVLVLVSASAFGPERAPDNAFEVAKNIDIFSKVMREVMTKYVDEVEPNQFARFGFDAMLKTLDPYSDYISAAEIDDYRFMSTGQYGGIGARIIVRDQRVYVTDLNPNSPAQKIGLRAGDEILQIDNEVIASRSVSVEQVSDLLKGQPKTAVRLRVRRPLMPEPLALTITREDIRVPNVEYATLLPSPKGPIAYVVLSGFTRDASVEVRKALEQLKAKASAGGPDGLRMQGASALAGVVLDLRGNPGGLLIEAVNVSNLFVPKGERIVDIKGRQQESTNQLEAPNSPFDLETPLAVLINRGSASASEIVAGVVQDLDRGVVVGRRSFGKGLVQTSFPLSYESQIKLTTARYYTPSGRCIQAIDYTHTDEEGGMVRRADSLKKEFFTRRGRRVLDSGGIDPDVKVDDLELHKVAVDLRNQFLVFDFASLYRAKHDKIAPPSEFKVDDALFAEFVRFAEERKFAYQSRAEQELAQMDERLQKEKNYATLKPQVDALRRSLAAESATAMATNRADISLLLKRELLGRYYHQVGEHEGLLRDDSDIRAAVEVLSSPERYAALLKPAAPKP